MIGAKAQPTCVSETGAHNRLQVDQDRLVLAGGKAEVRRDDDPAAIAAKRLSDTPRG
jgi:hypothetical protein